MKLRNKKTGRIFTVGDDIFICNDILGKIKLYWRTNGEDVKAFYDDLFQFNEEWEDYKPKEPLIKDPKIRKAVRAWAEANEVEELDVKGGCLVTAFISLHKHTEIDFNCSWTRDGVYTIEELCGEEEE